MTVEELIMRTDFKCNIKFLIYNTNMIERHMGEKVNANLYITRAIKRIDPSNKNTHIVFEKNLYTITHHESGFSILNFSDELHEIRKLGDAINKLDIDWESKKSISKSKDLKKYIMIKKFLHP